MAALGALFHEDARFVNRFGHYVRGVAEIVALHAPIHETIYCDSTLDNEVIDVIPVCDDAAVVYFFGVASPSDPSIRPARTRSTHSSSP